MIASAQALMLAVATGIVNLRHKRAVKVAQEAQVVGTASGQTTTYSAQATEAFDYDAQTVWSGIVIELPAGARLADPQNWWESHARPYLKRVKEVLSARQG